MSEDTSFSSAPSLSSASNGETEDWPDQLSTVYHDVNSSLAVIYGNAQLLSEMAQMEDLGDAFVQPLSDIQAAREEISEALEELNQVRQEGNVGAQ